MGKLPLVLRTTTAQSAVLPLLRIVLDWGMGVSQSGRVRLTVPRTFTLLLDEPWRRALALPVLTPNPFIRLARALMTYSPVQNELLLDRFKYDEYWDQLPDFMPKVGVSMEGGVLSVHAELEQREIISDLLSRDLLELSIVQEIMAFERGLPVGQLSVELKDCYLDAKDHLPHIRMLESGTDLPSIHEGPHLPIMFTNRQRWGEEAELLLRPDKPTAGFSEPWMRRVAAPMLKTFLSYTAGEPSWRGHLEHVRDLSWRAAAETWITQDLDRPKEERR